MMASQYVIEVNEMNFEYEVLSFSKNKPVLVDFWAEWCQPCKVLGPMLEKIVNEANGSLRLAKVRCAAGIKIKGIHQQISPTQPA